MTNQQILEKAIEKAERNGFNHERFRKEFEKRSSGLDYWKDLVPVAFERLIFSHPFAKAFWGKEKATFDTKEWGWKYHLTQMVLEKEPLKYLEKFL